MARIKILVHFTCSIARDQQLAKGVVKLLHDLLLRLVELNDNPLEHELNLIWLVLKNKQFIKNLLVLENEHLETHRRRDVAQKVLQLVLRLQGRLRSKHEVAY